MRVMTAIAGAAIFAGGAGAGVLWVQPVAAQSFAVVAECGAASAPQVRTTLYFGLQRPTGVVSELEWQIFLRDEVTRHFPAGLTVWEAQGQWRSPAGRIDHERSKVLLLVHPDTPAARQAIHALVRSYRKAFDQQSVLWERSTVCVAS